MTADSNTPPPEGSNDRWENEGGRKAAPEASSPVRKKRQVETDEERKERLKAKARKQIDNASADDDAIDAMVKRSIDQYGA